jgi:hypothetical protein
MKTKTIKRICLNPECGEEVWQGDRNRGLCGDCYRYAKSLIKREKTTEEELVKAGKMLPLDPDTIKRQQREGWFTQ